VSTPVLLVLGVVALVSLAAIAAVVSLLLSRLQRLARDVKEIEREVMPALDRLQADADVTGRELDRVSRSLDELSEQRASR
jgi:predicted PurR-regulated permease PerM